MGIILLMLVKYVLGAINVNDAIKRLKWGKSLVSL